LFRCVLKDGVLYYHKAKGDAEAAGSISLDGANVIEGKKGGSKKQGQCIEIHTGKRIWLLEAETAQDHSDWISALKRSVQPTGTTNTNKGPAPTEQLVLQAKGLMCERCAERVKLNIGKMSGVQSISVDIEEETVTIMGRVDITEILSYLEDAGYLASIQ